MENSGLRRIMPDDPAWRCPVLVVLCRPGIVVVVHVDDEGQRPRSRIGWTTPVFLGGLPVVADAASSKNQRTVSPDTTPKPWLLTVVLFSARSEIGGWTPLHRRSRLYAIHRRRPPTRERSRRRPQRGGPWPHVSLRSFASRTEIPGRVENNPNKRKCKPWWVVEVWVTTALVTRLI